jgi:hypothetical protein
VQIPIPIPIGAVHRATVQGAVWKRVSCERCQQPYAYLLELEARGEDHDLLFLDSAGSAERARQQAEQNLAEKSRNVVLPVPCPNCGFYQEEMAQRLKEEASINRLQITGLAMALLSLIPLAFGVPYLWVLTVILAVTGVSLLAWGYVVAARFDPNAGDCEARKAIGQLHAVWGAQLSELLAMNGSAKPAAEPDRGSK